MPSYRRVKNVGYEDDDDYDDSFGYDEDEAPTRRFEPRLSIHSN